MLTLCMLICSDFEDILNNPKVEERKNDTESVKWQNNVPNNKIWIYVRLDMMHIFTRCKVQAHLKDLDTIY